jgi:hypothetical protein
LQLQVGATPAIVAAAYSVGDITLGEGVTGLGDTNGHSYLPACSGVMTGVPTARTGWAPLIIDTTNHKVGIYSGGAWKWTAALT